MRLRPRLLTSVLVAALVPMLWGGAFAQQSPDQVPEHNLEAFEPVDLPDPNRYRDADGSPGRAYWQNAADYQIDVALDTARKRVTGTETITYTNNAPEALERLWVQLEQNYFKTGSRGNAAVPADRGGRVRPFEPPAPARGRDHDAGHARRRHPDARVAR